MRLKELTPFSFSYLPLGNERPQESHGMVHANKQLQGPCYAIETLTVCHQPFKLFLSRKLGSVQLCSSISAVYMLYCNVVRLQIRRFEDPMCLPVISLKVLK